MEARLSSLITLVGMYILLYRGYCTMSVNESLTSFMGGTILSYFVDVKKCHQYLDPCVNVTSFYGRETGAYIVYFNYKRWYFYLPTENYVDGKQFNLSAPVIRLMGTFITPSGKITVNVNDINSDGSILTTGYLECPGNDEKPGIEILADHRNKTSLDTVSSVKTVLNSALELSFAVNFSDCTPPEHMEAYMILGGVIKDIQEDGLGGYTFTQMTLAPGSSLLIAVRILSTGEVIVGPVDDTDGGAGGKPYPRHCILGKTFKLYAQ
ncbi:uncharacterized protein [Haliotis cracherodii]|uniref:uncharacterized protein n=1 Tax=Haliotis cracherodii TaxID=6455 RepID=UPI0039EC1C7C